MTPMCLSSYSICRASASNLVHASLQGRSGDLQRLNVTWKGQRVSHWEGTSYVAPAVTFTTKHLMQSHNENCFISIAQKWLDKARGPATNDWFGLGSRVFECASSIAMVFACICMPRVVAPCGFVQEDRVRPSEALPARWSDPCAMDGSHGSLRGGSARQFGPDMTQEFLEKMLGEGNAGQCGRWVDSVSPCEL